MLKKIYGFFTDDKKKKKIDLYGVIIVFFYSYHYDQFKSSNF